MAEFKFSDGDILNLLMKSVNYEYDELGISPMYIGGYIPTADELKDKPNSPMFNW